jgi:LPPG:FO 2-phospho-L-lactate transferase
MRAAGLEVSAWGIAQAYRDFLDGLVIDEVDAALKDRIEAIGVRAVVTDTIMRGPQEKANLARVVLAAGARRTTQGQEES